MKKIFFYFLLTIVVFVSCSQGETLDTTKNSSGVVDYASLQKFIDTRTNGYFNVTSSVGVSLQDFSTAEVSGAFAEEENPVQTLTITNSTINIGRASIGGIEIGGYKANIRSTENNYERPEDASHLYGQKIEFIIGKKGNLTKSNPEVVMDSMYIPEKILLLEPKLTYSSADTVYVGMQLKWNPDPKNDKGVMLLATYETTGNESFTEIHPNNFFRTIAVPDNGNCTLPTELFKDMPKGAFLDIELVRGNFQFTSSKTTEDIYSLHSYTSVRFFARLK